MNGPHISLFGRLTRDPELRYGNNNGTPYVNVRVACNTAKGPDQEAISQFFDATLWRYQAESIASNCRKGDMVYIHGSYELQTYNRNDGSQGTNQKISVKEFRHFSTFASQTPTQPVDDTPQEDEEQTDPAINTQETQDTQEAQAAAGAHTPDPFS